MKLVIRKIKDGSFEGDNGPITYYWYKAVKGDDGFILEFGSAEKYDVDDKIDVDIERTEYTDKKGNLRFRYKEVV